VNKNIFGMHQAYFAVFDMALDNRHTDKLTVKSNVAQTVYLSSYLYDMIHAGNGDCIAHWYTTGTRSDAWIKCDECPTDTDWNSFMY